MKAFYLAPNNVWLKCHLHENHQRSHILEIEVIHSLYIFQIIITTSSCYIHSKPTSLPPFYSLAISNPIIYQGCPCLVSEIQVRGTFYLTAKTE